MASVSTPDLAFDVVYQERYSRGELLLRSFFGFFYIMIPHAFLLFFMGIASLFVTFISWWAVLFTGKYPRSFFNFQLALLRWNARLTARIFNLADGYPPFGTTSADPRIVFDLEYPENLSRGMLILRTFFAGVYVVIPHGFCLFFRMIGTYFVVFISWWVVLFTGQYPKGMHDFVVGTFRWAMRVRIYLNFLTDKYPAFSGRPSNI